MAAVCRCFSLRGACKFPTNTAPSGISSTLGLCPVFSCTAQNMPSLQHIKQKRLKEKIWRTLRDNYFFVL
jgi:hypothetical protein